MNNLFQNSWNRDTESLKTIPGSLTNAFLRKVYVIMSAGLSISGLMAWFFYSMIANPGYGAGELPVKVEYLNLVQPPMVYLIMFAPVIFVLILSFGINRISYGMATLLFGAYALLNGISLSFIFLVYTPGSVATTFFVTAGMFLAMSLVGLTTKMDLTKIGSYLMMALIGIVIATLVNMFLKSGLMDYIISIIGVVVFAGLTAYDTQKILQIGMGVDAESDAAKKGAIMGALTLYLDFINLFLFLLRFLGNRRGE